MNDRIKLAEAMGWTRSTIGTEYCWRHEDGRVIGMCPDPFTDANDDFGVLEWMRQFDLDIYIPGDKDNEGAFNKWEGFTMALYECGKDTWEYKIGDYARAALKVIQS